jgi:repressor LexA
MTMLTRKQHEAFEFIRGYVARHGYSPSYENIMQGVGIHSKSGVHRLVGALAERGYIRRRKGRTRSIEVVAQETPTPAMIEAGATALLAFTIRDFMERPEQLAAAVYAAMQGAGRGA